MRTMNKRTMLMLVALLSASELVGGYVIFGITLLFILLWHDRSLRISKTTLALLSIVIIGSIVGLFKVVGREVTIRDYGRDGLYCLSPVVFMLFSQKLSKRYNIDDVSLDKLIITTACVISAIHLSLILLNLFRGYTSIRGVAGFSSDISMIAFCTLLYSSRRDQETYTPKYKMVAMGLIGLSLILYLSRTVIAVFFAYTFYIFWSNKSSKRIRMLLIIIAVLFAAYGVVQVLPNQYTQTLLSKTLNSLTEVSTRQDWSWDNVNANWRGYERYLLIRDFGDSTIIEKIFGHGFGKRLDLNLSIRLAGEMYSAIPTFHNAYLYLVFKTGIIGLACFLIFLMRQYKNVFRGQNFDAQMVKASIICVIIQSFISMYIFAAGGSLGIIFYIVLANKKKVKIN